MAEQPDLYLSDSSFSLGTFSTLSDAVRIQTSRKHQMGLNMLNGIFVSILESDYEVAQGPNMPQGIVRAFIAGDLVTFFLSNGTFQMKPSHCMSSAESKLFGMTPSSSPNSNINIGHNNENQFDDNSGSQQENTEESQENEEQRQLEKQRRQQFKEQQRALKQQKKEEMRKLKQQQKEEAKKLRQQIRESQRNGQQQQLGVQDIYINYNGDSQLASHRNKAVEECR